MIGWILFNILVVIMLLVDLLVFHRKAHKVSFKESLIWSCVWITLALLFNAYIYFAIGKEPAINFLTGYLIEKSLSVDNLFVFLLIFSYFRTPETSLHKVLFWGILGAILTRALFIFLGITLIQKFHFLLYLLGVLLVISGIKLALEKEKKIDPEKSLTVRLFRKFIPLTAHYEKDRFFVRKASRLMATPLCLVLLAIESTDIIFAIDSIPAIFAITLDPFIVYTSNIFAILGLRALFFVLSGAMKLFHYLHYGIALILVFVGSKMLLSSFLTLTPLFSLGIIFAILACTIFLSLIFKKLNKKRE